MDRNTKTTFASTQSRYNSAVTTAGPMPDFSNTIYAPQNLDISVKFYRKSTANSSLNPRNASVKMQNSRDLQKVAPEASPTHFHNLKSQVVVTLPKAFDVTNSSSVKRRSSLERVQILKSVTPHSFEA